MASRTIIEFLFRSKHLGPFPDTTASVQGVGWDTYGNDQTTLLNPYFITTTYRRGVVGENLVVSVVDRTTGVNKSPPISTRYLKMNLR